MGKEYWLSRKRASAANARGATSAEARLVHLDLAGRYSIRAAASAAPEAEQPLPPAVPQVEGEEPAYYEQLEIGARWLASRSAHEAEKREHLGMAERFARLRLEADGRE